MKVYTCKTFTGHWPVGSAAVVYAESQKDAAQLLNNVLKSEHSLAGDAKPEDMLEFPAISVPEVRVLVDGDY